MLHALGVLAAALVLGGMALFSFVMAPLVFRVLERETAATFMRAAFPRYYDTMMGAAIIAAGSTGLRDLIDAVLMGGVAVAFIVLRHALLPALNRHREARQAGDAAAEAAFRRLHGLSMVVNLVQMAVVAFVVVRLVT